jgi:ATP-dependent Lhr-like helicase
MNSPPSNSSRKVSSAFDLLHPKVQKWIWQQGWDELHDIQERTICKILNEQCDIVVSAATARGKTEAAFLPICSDITERALTSVRVLYIGPLKALINDQFARLDYLCEDLEIPVHRWHGDVGSGKKRKLIGKPSGILLITPESLEALFVIHGTKLKMIFKELSYVVVDELHSFIGNERGRQLQSLLHRIEIVLKRRIRRIALSATIGDMEMAAEFLRKGGSKEAELIESTDSSQEIKLQIRGYIEKKPDIKNNFDLKSNSDIHPEGDYIAIAQHLFKTLRGTDNLIFANRRQEVEKYADVLRRFCEHEKLPNEFFPHHGSISKDLRQDVELRLKDKTMPLNVVCTSTLEMGIDIGTVSSIAQIGVPCTVASIRQRLGRSGRRDDPAVLRMYIQESELTDKSPIQDTLRPHLIQSVAMVNLLIRKWYEPPTIGSLHLSTLIQQVLSMIAQYGGIIAEDVWRCLCKTGPFPEVDQSMFAKLLRDLGEHEIITQISEGILLLDIKGERMVNHYSFFAAFSTPEEYRLFADGKLLGTLPIAYPIMEGAYLIFTGRRWIVKSIDIQKKLIELSHAKGGRPPKFVGGGCSVNEIVREEMWNVYRSTEIPIYLDRTGQDLLLEGRKYFLEYQLISAPLLQSGKDTLLFVWKGDRILNTISVQLRNRGFRVMQCGFMIIVSNCTPENLIHHFKDIVQIGSQDPLLLASTVLNKGTEKHDRFLNKDLLNADYASRFLDIKGALDTISNITADF